MDRPAADSEIRPPAMCRVRSRVAAACLLVCLAASGVAGCSPTSRAMPDAAVAEKPASAPDASRTTLVLATTPAVADTGLGDALAADFGDRWSQYSAKVVSFPEGGAIAFASNGEADVMLVAGDAAAKALIAQGFATRSTPLMEDRLVLVGPDSDPAGVKKAATVAAALARIADTGGTPSAPGQVPVRFLGGISGVEGRLWAEAGRKPSGSWVVAVGKDVSRPVETASRDQAYAIMSRALFVRGGEAAKGLAVLKDGGSELTTRYFVLPLAGAADPKGAGVLASWLGDGGKAVVASFGERGSGPSPFVLSR